MSIRFKFRSSATFDSIDIGNSPSISIHDLKSRIVRDKKLDLCHNFDLVFSDPTTGSDFLDKDRRIPSGASVIIKRVPAGSVPSSPRAHAGSLKDFCAIDLNATKPSSLLNLDAVNFDDFGSEPCPGLELNLPDSDLNVEKKVCYSAERTEHRVARVSDLPVVKHQKLEASERSARVSGGNKDNRLEILSKATGELHMKLSSSPAMKNANYPPELYCPLCKMLFKEAVMIPCCQQSFCEKCILQVLVEKARCPECFSTRCKVEDLLPNICLRQTILHSIEFKLVFGESEDAFQQCASDGESRIEGKDLPYAVSITSGKQKLHSSPDSEDGGSNHVAFESMGGNSLDEDKELKSNYQSIKEEAESILEENKPCCLESGGLGKASENGRLKKGERTCYMCGSAQHFIKNCPVASTAYDVPYMLQRRNPIFPEAVFGRTSPYWNGPSFPVIRPSTDAYTNFGIMPFGAVMFNAAPFPLPAYGSPVFQVKPDYRGQLVNNLSDGGKRYWYGGGTERPGGWNFPVDRAKSLACSGDPFTRNSHRKCTASFAANDGSDLKDDERLGRSFRVGNQENALYYHEQRTISEVDDVRSSGWHTKERHKLYRKGSNRRYEKDEQCNNDSSWSYNMTDKDDDLRGQSLKHDRGNQRHHSCAESSEERTLPGIPSKERKRESSICSSSRPGYKVKSRTGGSSWSHDSAGKDNEYCKWRRLH